MNYYLIYESHCSTCSQTATIVKDASDSKLTVLSIRSKIAQNFLNQAYPQGWRYRPYLIKVEDSQVKAWSGINLALRLVAILGIKGLYSLWFSTSPGENGQQHVRRQLLKAGVGLGFLSMLSGLFPSQFPPPVLAKSTQSHTGNCPCHPCTGECYVTAHYENCICYSPCGGCPEYHLWIEDVCYCDECGNYATCFRSVCYGCIAQ